MYRWMRAQQKPISAAWNLSGALWWSRMNPCSIVTRANESVSMLGMSGLEVSHQLR